MTAANLDSLSALRAKARLSLQPDKPRIAVGMATCGLAAGAQEVFEAVREELERQALDTALVATGCLGWCQREPLLDVSVPGRGRALYERVTTNEAVGLVRALARRRTPELQPLARVPSDGPCDGAGLGDAPLLDDLPFYRRQQRVVLRNCGLIDPESLEEFVAAGGYEALALALSDRTPEAVVEEILRSELRGRGGAGFPTGRKWLACREVAAPARYVICNCDEGDPGAYMDRTLLESDPFSVLEGMALAAYAVGAEEGYLYVRNEYPLAVERVTRALTRARREGLLGRRILGSSFSFDLEVVRGGGAFVCGEETALIASLEGGGGEPRTRPPYPAVSGLWGRPTLINNVKTFATVPEILTRGAEWYRSMGRDRNRGTVVFSLVGNVANTGLVEVPLATSLRQLVEEIGGGAPGGHRVKAVQTGGPSGGCLPSWLFELPITYETMTAAGSIMGSGGLVVLDDRACMVDVARYFLSFTLAESCGKCTPCREGTRALHELLGRITEGRGRSEDLDTLEEIAEWVKTASLCGLGQTAPNPVLSTLRHFRSEYLAHVHEGRCPAGACRALIRLRIDPKLCSGCGSCEEVCPVQAIRGEGSADLEIDPARCTRCRSCIESCPVGAIEAVGHDD